MTSTTNEPAGGRATPQQMTRKHVFVVNRLPDFLDIVRHDASTRDIRILLLSTTPDLLEKAREQHARFGNDRYLLKPFDLDDMLQNIREMIGEA